MKLCKKIKFQVPFVNKPLLNKFLKVFLSVAESGMMELK